MPPIFVEATNIKDYGAFRRRVAKTCTGELKIAYRLNAITIFTFNRVDHAKLFGELKEGNIPAHSHKLKSDKDIIYVLKDLPKGLTVEEVTEGITDVLPAVKVLPLFKCRVDFEDDKYPYFIVHLPPSFDARKLLKLYTILVFRIRWEKLNTMPQVSTIRTRVRILFVCPEVR